MNDARQKEVLAWLYDNCSHKWFTPWVLDPVANKAGNPPGNMSWTEILSMCEALMKDGYILAVTHPSGFLVFFLNEMKEKEWRDKIDSTAPTKAKMMGDLVVKGASFASREITIAIVSAVAGYVIAQIT